jgi:hypothetical protein
MSVVVAILATAWAAPISAQRIATSGKRGIPYNDASLAKLFSNCSAQVTWGCNWGYPSNGLNSKLDFVPMLFNIPASWQNTKSTKEVPTAIANGTTHILRFDEPDPNNESPAAAAVAYKSLMQQFTGKVKIRALVVSNSSSKGIAWMKQFLRNCTSCTIEFVPFHKYASLYATKYFADYMQQIHAAVGYKKLWITKFVGDGDAADQIEFLKTVLPWLESLSYVDRYSYFMADKGRLINAAGNGLSEVGMAFATISGVNATIPTSWV